ncbi:MAG TPA: non-heme iron oxygenase ferredoxin subunit [Candidatus Thermoplasmatota archaeon]|nr:non-heme iron oxygenase ferredoxin subunit [Candidatus Thermoplasmatota archaeon]
MTGRTAGVARVCPIEELPPGTMRGVLVDGRPVLVANVEGTLRAVDRICTHAEVDLAGGWLRAGTVTCPAHGSEFDLATGEALSPPAYDPLAVHRAFLQDGWVHVEIRSEEREGGKSLWTQRP